MKNKWKTASIFADWQPIVVCVTMAWREQNNIDISSDIWYVLLVLNILWLSAALYKQYKLKNDDNNILVFVQRCHALPFAVATDLRRTHYAFVTFVNIRRADTGVGGRIVLFILHVYIWRENNGGGRRHGIMRAWLPRTRFARSKSGSHIKRLNRQKTFTFHACPTVYITFTLLPVTGKYLSLYQ